MNDGGLLAPSSSPGTPTQAQIIQEALELQNFQINSTLLDYGLNTGLIERLSNGQMIMGLLNIKLMSGSQVVRSVLLEFFMRLGVFVSATSLVKMAIDSDQQDTDAEDGIRGLYILSIVAHQVVNFDSTNIRTINRLLMSMAILLFSITTPNSPPCENMKNFKQKIRKRLAIDYYLWCLLFAMDLVLTCSSPLHINLEQEYGTELNVSHVMLSSYCVIHLSKSLQMIGHGRLSPLIMGTPLLFLDAGDSMSAFKGLSLFLYYLCFWCSDWRELVDWNHLMLCDAGVCNVLSNERGTLRQIKKKAKLKFDDWLIEHGLDDEGWFILLDPPTHRGNESIVTPSGVNSENEGTQSAETNHEGTEETSITATEQERSHLREVDYSGRAIYLQSRNPLLTSLAAIIIIVWK